MDAGFRLNAYRSSVVYLLYVRWGRWGRRGRSSHLGRPPWPPPLAAAPARSPRRTPFPWPAARAERELAAGTDSLTELANRRAMDEHLRRLDGAEVPYTVIVADLDHFKQINDTHGHDVGDRCLQLFADILKEACRDTDIACRPGGEEFSLILSGAGTDAGMAVASRIRAMPIC